jgi:hypothetical protein
MITTGKQIRPFKLNFKTDTPIAQSSTGATLIYPKHVMASAIKQEFVGGKLAIYSQFDQNSLQMSEKVSVADAQMQHLIGYVEEFKIEEDGTVNFNADCSHTILQIDTDEVYAITMIGTPDTGPVRTVQNVKIVCLVLSKK